MWRTLTSESTCTLVVSILSRHSCTPALLGMDALGKSRVQCLPAATFPQAAGGVSGSTTTTTPLPRLSWRRRLGSRPPRAVLGGPRDQEVLEGFSLTWNPPAPVTIVTTCGLVWGAGAGDMVRAGHDVGPCHCTSPPCQCRRWESFAFMLVGHLELWVTGKLPLSQRLSDAWLRTGRHVIVPL